MDTNNLNTMDIGMDNIGFNVPKLINLVSPHEALYNPRHVRFRDRKYTTAVWKAIAAELGTNDFEAKTKWQNLRSNFMRERRKLIRRRGAGQTWVFYKKLLFLEKFLKFDPNGELDTESGSHKQTFMTAEVVFDNSQRQVISSLGVCPNTKQEEPSYDFLGDNCVSSDAGSASWDESTDHTKKNQSYEELMLSTEDPLEVRNCTCQTEDTDLSFFKGLLPHIKRLEHMDNLAFKREVVQLLEHKLQSTK